MLVGVGLLGGLSGWPAGGSTLTFVLMYVLYVQVDTGLGLFDVLPEAWSLTRRYLLYLSMDCPQFVASTRDPRAPCPLPTEARSRPCAAAIMDQSIVGWDRRD